MDGSGCSDSRLRRATLPRGVRRGMGTDSEAGVSMSGPWPTKKYSVGMWWPDNWPGYAVRCVAGSET